MSDALNEANASELAELPCNTIVYRVILKKKYLDPDNNSVLAPAFMPRPRDADGLSVVIARATSHEELVEGAREAASPFTRPPAPATATLHVGWTRDIEGLDVLAAPLPDLPNHALITGVPLPEGDADVLAERLAGQLARISRVMWLKPR